MKKLLLISAILIFVMGCCLRVFPNSPNTVVIHQVGNSEVLKLFSRLYRIDSGIAIELAKLPEFQTAPGDCPVRALARFVDLCEKMSYAEKVNLDGLLKVGIPEVRKYSALLQAILWVLEKENDENVFMYSWKELLDKAWDFSDRRWADFETVTDRLHAPRLIDYYEKKVFEYTLDVDKPWDARYVFLTHRGSCLEITMFSLICLRKGGYIASAHDPRRYEKHFPSLHLHVIFRGKDGRLYSMDNGRPDKKGIEKFP